MDFISIIMSTYNESENYLRQSIESILKQTHSLFEFIIVLDNPDNEEIKRIVYEYSHIDKRIIIVENKENIGLTNSLNKALEFCKGDYIARMDADDISDSCRLDRQLKYLKKHNYDLIGSKVRRIDEKGNIVQNISNHPITNKLINRVLKYDNCVPHPTWFVKRKVYFNLNGYRNLHTCEDYDFLLRCKKKYRIGNLNEVTLSYRLNPNSISRSNALKQLLSVKYLQKKYRNIDFIDQSDLDNYINNKASGAAAKKFDRAQFYFKEALINKEKAQFYKMILNLVRSLKASKFILIRLKNIFMIRIIRLIKSDVKRRYL